MRLSCQPAGGESVVTLDLWPGRYAILCFIPSPDGTPHVMNGSVNAITQVGNKIIAAGTYHRNLVGDLDAAEVAFLVEDSQQRRGLGSILLEHLAAVCRAHDPRRAVDGTSEVIVIAALDHPRVQAATHAQRNAVGRGRVRKRLLQVSQDADLDHDTDGHRYYALSDGERRSCASNLEKARSTSRRTAAMRPRLTGC